MNWAALVSAIMPFLQHKSTKPIGLAFLMLILFACMSQLYAKFTEYPSRMASAESRISTIEHNDISSGEQLKAMYASLLRIEQMQAETRKDVSDLKTALIKR